MDFGNLIQQAAILALPLLFAITLSEAARGHAAYMLGDKTGQSMGRLSWNPSNHVSLIETILIPLLMFFATSGSFVFGNARPVPIDYRNLKPTKMRIVSLELAGPLALLFMALLWLSGLEVLTAAGVNEPFLLGVCKAGVFVCLSLFAFQLLPLPPLAGGRVLLHLLPYKYAIQFSQVERWSVWIILLLAIVGILGPLWLSPITQLALGLLQWFITPLSFLLN